MRERAKYEAYVYKVLLHKGTTSPSIILKNYTEFIMHTSYKNFIKIYKS